jgi:predicted acetyltransferase
LYLQQARHTPGALERGKFSWLRAREPRGEKATGYKAVNARGEIEGYLYVLQKDAPAGHGTLFNLNVADIQFATPDGGRALLGLLHQHRSVCDTATLFGSPDHPLLALIPERTFTAKHQFHWMLRIVDVREALTARGWNPRLRGEVHLDVQDDVLDANRGRYVLAVESGEAQVRAGGRGDAHLDIRGLAALYTGHLSPHDLMALGLLRIAQHVRDARAVMDTLGALFAGARPWLSDMF